MKAISESTKKIILGLQKNEITESVIYRNISKRVKNIEDKKILENIALEETKHAKVWEAYTKEKVSVNTIKVWVYTIMAFIFGYTFTLKKLEGKEKLAQVNYDKLSEEIPEAKQISEDEAKHERELLSILDEERLRYVGSMVLGLNDALVELTGTIAGLSFALQDTKLVALSGLITGIAATLSMASSEYLSAKADGDEDALKSCIYTGIAYLITVILLVAPYLLFDSSHVFYALTTMIVIVLLIILVFNYYIAVAKDLSFKKRFFEMASISLGVAFLSFIIGILVKQFLGIDI